MRPYIYIYIGWYKDHIMLFEDAVRTGKCTYFLNAYIYAILFYIHNIYIYMNGEVRDIRFGIYSFIILLI